MGGPHISLVIAFKSIKRIFLVRVGRIGSVKTKDALRALPPPTATARQQMKRATLPPSWHLRCSLLGFLTRHVPGGGAGPEEVSLNSKTAHRRNSNYTAHNGKYKKTEKLFFFGL